VQRQSDSDLAPQLLNVRPSAFPHFRVSVFLWDVYFGPVFHRSGAVAVKSVWAFGPVFQRHQIV